MEGFIDQCVNPKTWSVELFSTMSRYYRTSRFVKELKSQMKVQKMSYDLNHQQLRGVRTLVAYGYIPSSYLDALKLSLERQKLDIKRSLTDMTNQTSSLGLLQKILLRFCKAERSNFSKQLMLDSVQNQKTTWKSEVENLEIEISLQKQELEQHIAVEEFSKRLYARQFMTKLALQRDINATKTARIYLEQSNYFLDVSKQAVAYYHSRLSLLDKV